ncbi:MAG: hypothetical protein LBL90_14320 [Prevotellaceae bacterium]|jgi:hypothetical protein|nr:hypothetical protein [Prevotellaceae bacterium]
MELDKLKASWKETSKNDSFISPDEIKGMLRNKSNGALNKLIQWEKNCIWIIIVIMPFFLGILYMQSLLKNEFSSGLLWLGIAFSIYAVYSLFVVIYKYRYLKKIDMLKMDIITVSNMITKIKRFVIYDLIVSFCLLVPFVFFIITIMLGKDEEAWLYVLLTIYTIVLVVIAFFILKKYYFGRIKTIQRAIKEIKEFEAED